MLTWLRFLSVTYLDSVPKDIVSIGQLVKLMTIFIDKTLEYRNFWTVDFA